MQRPTGITILAILSFIISFLLFCVPLSLWLFHVARAARGGTAPGNHGFSHMGLAGDLAIGTFLVVFLVFAVLYLVNGIGLLRLRNWARWLTVILLCIDILHVLRRALFSLRVIRFSGAAVHLIVLALCIWAIAYLFQPDVKKAFGAS